MMMSLHRSGKKSESKQLDCNIIVLNANYN